VLLASQQVVQVVLHYWAILVQGLLLLEFLPAL
jgi:hypothetical protein